ncbi:MAG: AAA family ATPase [Candidatus Nanopelagicales bacterium]
MSDALEPIEPNAGGIVESEELVGRGAVIGRLLKFSAPPHAGAILLGDRRIGKTSLLRAVEERLRDAGHLVVRVSAETASLEGFARSLAAGLRCNPRWKNWEFDLSGEGSVTVGVGKVTVGMKARRVAEAAEKDLFAACAQAARQAGPHYRVIFLLDEITVLAGALAKDSPREALEFMHMLRRARQEVPEVAMFLAGSIGLHHAVDDLTVVDDIQTEDVDVLEPPAARELALRLILGARLPVVDSDAVAAAMVTQTSGFPYYLHGLAQLLQQEADATPVTAATVARVFQDALDQALWNIRHYDSRLDSYYGAHAELVRQVLDAIATADTPLTPEKLLAVPVIAQFDPGRDKLLRLLARLEADHYLRRRGHRDEMANALIRRIWRQLRRLG